MVMQISGLAPEMLPEIRGHAHYRKMDEGDPTFKRYRALTPVQMVDLNIPTPEWLIEDLLPQGYSALLCGPPKSGKGLLTIDMISAVAEGTKFLGKEVVQGPVIYASAEEALGEMKERLFSRIGENHDLPIHILPIDGTFDQYFKLENEAHVEGLVHLIEEKKATLVVLDVLRRVHDSKENEADSMYQILDVVQRMSRRTGAAIVVNHHTNKNGTPRGSTSIEGGVDVAMTLCPDGANSVNLSSQFTAKGRSVKEITLPVYFDGTARWIKSDYPLNAGEASKTQAERVVEALSARSEALSVPEIAAITGIPQASLGTTISNLKKESPGLLVETKREGKGSPKAYLLNAD